MAIDRTLFNLWVNDDESNTVGTLITKTRIDDDLLDPIDAAIAAAGSDFISAVGLTLGSLIQPTIDADTNNWNPTGLATAGVIQAGGATANRTITGLAELDPCRVILFINFTGFSYLFPNESTSSTAGNRFRTGGDVTVTCRANGSVLLVRGVARWHVLGP